MKKILILYTSVGLGHKTIAENIGYALEHAGYQVLLHDILKVQAGRLVNFGTSIHAFINRRLPWLWRFIYFYGHYVLYPFRIAIASKNYGQLKKVVDHFGPDMIISTQTTSSAVVAYMKRKGFFKGLFGIGFSDYHFHPYWVYKEADFYLANIEEQKQEMVRRGIPENRIFVCGMTLQPKTQVDIVSVKQRLGILPEEKVVLMASGSLGIGPSSADWLRLVAKLKQQALQQGLKLKLCIITGKNQELYQELQKNQDETLLIFPFYKPLYELYAIANAFVTKPGGLTVAESLLWQLPLFITHWLPGQEEPNVAYLKSHGLIQAFPGEENEAALVTAVLAELKSGQLRTALGNNQSREKLIDPTEPGRRAVASLEAMFHTQRSV